MASLDVADTTATVLLNQAQRAMDAYLGRLAVTESTHQHAGLLGEDFYTDAESERLAG